MSAAAASSAPVVKSHSTAPPAGGKTIIDKSSADVLVAEAAKTNTNVDLARNHPDSDTTTTAVGLAVLEKGGDFVRFEYHPRKLGEDDVEVDIQFAGICGSDLHTFDSGWGPAMYPVITGHEIIGRVSKIGSKVTRLTVGQMVGVGTEVLTCRKCTDCLNADDAYCTQKVFTYNAKYPDGQTAFGGYQNKVRVHNEWAFPLPSNLDPAAAAPLLCAGVTVYAPLLRHQKAGMTVGVVGIGGLGHLAIQYAAKLGASKVTAISTSLRKKEDALKLGATDFLVSTDAEAMKAALYSFDIIVLTADPDNLNLDPYLLLLKTGGRLIPVAAPETPYTYNNFFLLMRRLNITGSLVGSKGEVQGALDFAAKHNIQAVVERFPIAKASEAIARVRTNNIKYRAVLELPLP